MALKAVILAAGQGTRMHSSLPKVLHPLAGRPLLSHVVATARALEPAGVQVVYGHGGAEVRQRLGDLPVAWVEQDQQLGTGHAVAQALADIDAQDTVLVLYGDVPLIQTATLQRLLAAFDGADLALLTVRLDDPTGYGRIVRTGPDQRVAAIVEERDASDAQRSIREVHTGILAARGEPLRRWVRALDNRNRRGEYYLTDIVGLAVQDGRSVTTVVAENPVEVQGVNDRAQLAQLERHWQLGEARRLMAAGVTLLDPTRIDVRGQLEVGRDVLIDVNVVFEGTVRLGDGVYVGPFCLIRDTVIGAGTRVESHTTIDRAHVGRGARVGPYTRIRPGTRLSDNVHVGNFVELKQSDVGDGSKINHLSYIGDCLVGAQVNIGAGTITCNYDGAHKHQTIIGDNAFIGSHTQLVAPVTVHAGATIGAGTTITADAPAGKLTLGRAPQQTVEGWKRPAKHPKD